MYLDANGDQQEQSSSLLDASLDVADNEDDAGPSCQLGSQAQPLEISSSDSEPRRSGRVRRATRIVESQLSHRLRRVSYLLRVLRLELEL